MHSMSGLGVRPKPSTIQGTAKQRSSEGVTHCCHIYDLNVRSCREVPSYSRIVATIEPNFPPMALNPRIWQPVAAVLSAANLVAVWFAAAPAEPLHASIHAALAVGFALGAQRLGARRRALSITGESLAAEVLEEQSILRSEVAELSERLDFAERLLAEPRPAENRPSSLNS